MTISARSLFAVLSASLAGCLGTAADPGRASGPGGSTYAATVLADEPVAFWRFEEDSGGVAIDSSGRNRPGFYLNGPVLGDSAGASRTGAAVSLQNETDGVFVEYAQWTNLAALTVEAWVRPSRLTTSEGMIVVDKGYSWNLFIDPRGRPAFQLPGDTPPETVAPTAIAVGGTYHLVGTFQDGVMVLYVNGVPVSEAVAAVRMLPSNPTPIHVGRGLGGRRFEFEGVIDDVALYDEALSAEAILRHYRAGR